jgi:prevent-host-death family protein
MAREIPVTQARDELADLVNRVAYGDERVVLTRHGRPVAALVSPGDLSVLEQHDRDQHERAQREQTIRLTEAGERAGSADSRVPVAPAEPLRIAAKHRAHGPGAPRSPGAPSTGTPSPGMRP